MKKVVVLFFVLEVFNLNSAPIRLPKKSYNGNVHEALKDSEAMIDLMIDTLKNTIKADFLELYGEFAYSPLGPKERAQQRKLYVEKLKNELEQLLIDFEGRHVKHDLHPMSSWWDR